MTEAEWQTCEHRYPMIVELGAKATDRKLRLLACAVCRLEWHLLIHEASRSAVSVAEEYADGAVDEVERDATARLANDVAARLGMSRLHADIGYTATDAWYTLNRIARAAISPSCDADATEWYAENGVKMPHSQLVRELFGNPFRPVPVDPAWLTPAVIAIAETIYDDRTFDRMPELANGLHEHRHP
jgi:hypothetical protein